tara:strand:+ start:503 stop:979 length:477 start_codon:yes stop_codon:yes gene_type:complete
MKSITNIKDQIDLISKQVMEFKFPLSYNKKWSSYNVIIEKSLNLDSSGTKIRRIITPYHRELSWLFFQLKKAFKYHIDTDERFGVEFFGRLSNTAKAVIKNNKRITVVDMLMFTLIESALIAEEMKNNQFLISNKSMGDIIIDDIRSSVIRKKWGGVK